MNTSLRWQLITVYVIFTHKRKPPCYLRLKLTRVIEWVGVKSVGKWHDDKPGSILSETHFVLVKGLSGSGFSSVRISKLYIYTLKMISEWMRNWSPKCTYWNVNLKWKIVNFFMVARGLITTIPSTRSYMRRFGPSSCGSANFDLYFT